MLMGTQRVWECSEVLPHGHGQVTLSTLTSISINAPAVALTMRLTLTLPLTPTDAHWRDGVTDYSLTWLSAEWLGVWFSQSATTFR